MFKKCSIFVLLLMFLAIAFSIETVSVVANEKEQTQYLHADYLKDYDELNLLEEFQYSFVGKIDSYISTSQYNGYGTDIPYSYFYVNILEEVKGDVEDRIVIKFYGGYNEENKLILLDGMSYPQVNETYRFYCNKTNCSYDLDGRTIDNSYVITMNQNLERLDNSVQEVSNLNSNISELNNNISLDSMTRGFQFEVINDGGGGATNYSFSTAYSLSIGDSRSVYISSGQERYYKITRTTLDYLTIYSIGSYDTMVYLYDSNYNLIGSNDDVNSSDSRALSYTTGRNFFYNFYCDKNETYYIKVKFYSSSVYGTFTMNLIKDNWYQSSNISDLFWEYDGVDGKNKVDYTIKSKYVVEIGYGINEWNKLGTIQFKPDTGSTTNDITISDYYDNETGAAVAVTTYNWIFTMTVKYNTFYFDTMTQNQRIKTVLHEFGHVLGLDEFTGIENTNNVMHQGIRELTKLGPADIAAYRAKWG